MKGNSSKKKINSQYHSLKKKHKIEFGGVELQRKRLKKGKNKKNIKNDILRY